MINKPVLYTDTRIQRDLVINESLKLLGRIKYVFGGKGIRHGLADCSQFTRWTYLRGAGIDIGRTTNSQIKKGINIDKRDLEEGDLIFFKNTYKSRYIYGVSHVGIYLGDNQMIHNNSKSGGVEILDDVWNDPFWSKHFLKCKKILL